MDDRRLPIYILVDVSRPMDGEPIQAVIKSIRQLVDELRQDPRALETCWLSVITFGDTAQQVVPLTDLDSFKLPALTTGGGATLGPALSLLCECREREIVRGTEESRGDYRPIVYAFVNGSKAVGNLAQGIQDFKSKKWGKYVFIATGADANITDLKRINPESIIRVNDIRPGTLAKYFAWPSPTGSLRTHSRHIGPTENIDEGLLEGQPPLFDGMQIDEDEVEMPTIRIEDESFLHHPSLAHGEEQDRMNISPHERRLPIYLLVDVSASMEGEPIQLVNTAILQLIAELRQDPKALDAAWLSVITFSDDAQQVVPLSDMADFQVPELGTGGKTNLGAALSLLCECCDREVRKRDATRGFDGDFRPVVFVFTDGKTDVGDLEQGIRDFRSKRWGEYVFCAGSDADVSDLKRISAEAVIRLDNLGHGTLSKYFRRFWMDDDSIKISSRLLRKRLTAYIAIDSSETMNGMPMEAVRLGLRQLATDLSHRDTEHTELLLGVISFGDEAVELVEPIAPDRIAIPEITTGCRAAIWKGLRLLAKCAKRDQSELSYPPLLFLLSADGRKTDGMDEGLRSFRSQAWGKIALCAAGPGADTTSLLRIERKAVFQLNDLRPTTFLKYFDWVSQSIQSLFAAIDGKTKDGKVAP